MPPAARPAADRDLAGGTDVEDSQQAHANDLAALEDLADRVGVPVYDSKVDQILPIPTR